MDGVCQSTLAPQTIASTTLLIFFPEFVHKIKFVDILRKYNILITD